MRTGRAAALLAYNALVVVVAIVALPVVAFLCLVRPAWRVGLGNRLGGGWTRPDGEQVLWAHAASVGEMEGLLPLVERWQAAHPGGAVVVSSQTVAGCDVARRVLPGASVRLMPLDFPGLARRVARRMRPTLYLFTENELWPNLLAGLRSVGTPAVQVSGRLSPRAASALAWVPGGARAVLGSVGAFLVQDEEQQRRLLALGVPAARVRVTGSLKGDRRPPAASALAEAMAASGRAVVVAGSTHEGEEEFVVAAVRELRDRSTELLWVLAPRHAPRFDEVAALVDREGLVLSRWSAVRDTKGRDTKWQDADVLLLDTIGELAGAYVAARVAFIGGSLVPVGGHNLLEAAVVGTPIVVGPHLDTVRALAGRLVEAGAAVVVESAEELADAVMAFLDPARAAGAAAAGRAIAAEQSGALDRTWDSLPIARGAAV